MLLNIVTPNKKLIVDEKVYEVIVPANKGELAILEGHSPLITTLEIGVLKYRNTENGEVKQFAISWGYCEIAGNKIQILAERAESSLEVDKDRSQKALKDAELKLENYNDLSMQDIEKYTNKVKRAQARLSIIK